MFLTVTSLKFVLLQYGFCLSTLIFWYGKFSSFLRWFYTKYLKNKMQTKNLQINLSYCRNPNTPDSHFACWLCCFCLFHSLAFFPSVSVLLSLFVLQHNSAFRADRALQRNSLAERSFCTLSLSIRSLYVTEKYKSANLSKSERWVNRHCKHGKAPNSAQLLITF